MEPLHFGDVSAPLFGVRHPARGAPRQTAVLICQSWGMEYLRAYRGLRALAELLAAKGFEVLRFDYHGTADSGGSALESAWPRWLADTATAARELRELSGASRLCLLGLRFGALVAGQAAAGCRAQDVVLWDAPASGAAFVDEMRALQDAVEAERARLRTRSAQLPPAPDELLGHAWPAELDAAVRALAAPVGALRLRSSDSAAQPGDVVLADASSWGQRERLSTPWNPQPSLRRVADLLAERLP